MKTLLCYSRNFEGVIYYELVPNNSTIDQTSIVFNSTVCTQSSVGIPQNWSIKSEWFCSKTTARRTKEKIKELDAIVLLPHPAYSADLAPSDCHLFRSMEHFLHGRRFDNLEQVEAGCREFFNLKDKEWYRRGIKQLTDRWLQIIVSNGLYFET